MKANNSTSNAKRGVLASTGISNLYRDTLSGVYYARKKFKVGAVTRDLNRSLETDTKGTALERLPAKLVDMAKEVERPAEFDNGVTFGECLDRFMAGKVEQNRIGKLDSTSLRSLQFCKNKLVEVWGQKFMSLPIRKLKFEDFESKHNNLHTTMGATYVNEIRSMIINAFKIAVTQRVIDSNPCEALHTKNSKAKKEVPQDDEQLNQLLEWIVRPGYSNRWKYAIRDLVEFFCWFGSRLTETKMLRKEDVNVSDKYRGNHPPMTIRFREGTTKNDQAKYVPIFPGALPLVERLLADKSTGEKLLKVSECFKTLNAGCEALDFPNWTHHTFRHVFASRALMATNCDFFVVAQWLGHRDGGRLLAKTYAHLNQQHSQAQAKKLNYNFKSAAATVAPTPNPDAVIVNGTVYTMAELIKLLPAQPANVINLKAKVA